MTDPSLEAAFAAIGLTDADVRNQATTVVRDFLEQCRRHFTETANRQTNRDQRELNLIRADGFSVTIYALDKEENSE